MKLNRDRYHPHPSLLLNHVTVYIRNHPAGLPFSRDCIAGQLHNKQVLMRYNVSHGCSPRNSSMDKTI